MEITETIKLVGMGFLLGLTVGVYIGMRFNKKELDKHKSLAIIIATIWVLFHIVAFFIQGTEINIFFNVVGALAVGDVVGLNVVAPVVDKLIDRITKK